MGRSFCLVLCVGHLGRRGSYRRQTLLLLFVCLFVVAAVGFGLFRLDRVRAYYFRFSASLSHNSQAISGKPIITILLFSFFFFLPFFIFLAGELLISTAAVAVRFKAAGLDDDDMGSSLFSSMNPASVFLSGEFSLDTLCFFLLLYIFLLSLSLLLLLLRLLPFLSFTLLNDDVCNRVHSTASHSIEWI